MAGLLTDPQHRALVVFMRETDEAGSGKGGMQSGRNSAIPISIATVNRLLVFKLIERVDVNAYRITETGRWVAERWLALLAKP